MGSLYDKEAELYNLLYHDLDYQSSAQELHLFLKERMQVPDGARLLEAACGTASFLNPLSAWYSVSGFDNSQGQVDAGLKSYPHLDLWTADMTDFSVDEPYDVLCCLFSSIGYLTPQSQMQAGLKCFAKALKPGGTLIIQPWFKPSAYMDGMPGLTTYDGEDIKISRQAVSRIENGNAILNFHFLVTKTGEEPIYFTNRHTLGLYSVESMHGLLDEAGFEVNYTEDGPLASRGLYFGKRR